MAEVEATSHWMVREGLTEQTKFKPRPQGREGACHGYSWKEHARKRSTKSLQGELVLCSKNGKRVGRAKAEGD